VLQFEVKTAKQATRTGASRFARSGIILDIQVCFKLSASHLSLRHKRFLRAEARFQGIRNVGNPARRVAAVLLGKLQTGG
jgi:hypothetical protein